MPIAYFKCQCGTEHRAIVEQDHAGFTLNPRNGHWYYDPSKKDEVSAARAHKCENCGLAVPETPDPKAVPTKFLFNWLADD